MRLSFEIVSVYVLVLPIYYYNAMYSNYVQFMAFTYI